MSLVIVVQVKNLKNAVGLYKVNIKSDANINITIVAIKIFFLETNASLNLLAGNRVVLKLSGLSIKPFPLPIFKNLFFL